MNEELRQMKLRLRQACEYRKKHFIGKNYLHDKKANYVEWVAYQIWNREVQIWRQAIQLLVWGFCNPIT